MNTFLLKNVNSDGQMWMPLTFIAEPGFNY